LTESFIEEMDPTDNHSQVSEESFLDYAHDDTPGTIEVRRKYADLAQLIEGLSDKLGDVTSHQEQEFLSAYRVHQLKIQEELKDLKEKVAKAEESLVEDGAVARMKEECNWFRDESKRLQSHATAMTKDFNLLNMRLKELRQQKYYLSDQLKAILKRSRVYEAEIEYVLDLVDDGSGTRGGRSSGSLRSDSRSKQSSREKSAKKTMQQTESTPNLATLPKKIVAKSHSMQNLHVDKIEHNVKHFKELKEKYDDKLQDMMDGRSKADVCLENAIHSQFNKVVARKTQSVLRGLKNPKDIREYTRNGGAPGRVPPAFAHDIPKINGLTGLGVEYLTEMDKFQAMVDLLSDADVFRNVVGELSTMVMEKPEAEE
jgi:hypothetical protein